MIKLFFDNGVPKVNITLNVYKGQTAVPEDFVRAKVYLWLCSDYDKTLLSCTTSGGQIKASFVQGTDFTLEAGVYSLKALWVKDADRELSIGSRDLAKVCMTEVKNAFLITTYEEDATSGIGDSVSLNYEGRVSTYGYDGLSAYEAAVLYKVTTALSEKEYVQIRASYVDTNQIKDSAITTAKIADEAVTTDKIKDKNVTTDNIADKAVTTDKIKDLNVTTDKIENEAVTTAKIADKAVITSKLADYEEGDEEKKGVTTAKLADGSVTTAKLADYVANDADKQGVTTEKIAPEAVTTSKIKDGAVDTDKLADYVEEDDEKRGVTTDKLANLSVTTAKLADYVPNDEEKRGVTTAKIADKAVTTSKIKDGAVTTAKIEDYDKDSAAQTGVTTAKIADKAVTTAKLQDYTEGDTGVTTAKIADKAVTNAKIADKTIENGKIADDAIENGKIKDKTLENGKFADKTIENGKIADGTITNDKLAGNIDGSKIADNTIDATTKIIDGTIDGKKIADYVEGSAVQTGITTAKIADGAVTNDKLALGAITADKIADDALEKFETEQSERLTELALKVGSYKDYPTEKMFMNVSALAAETSAGEQYISVIPVQSGDIINVTANANYKLYYAVLKSYPAIGSYDNATGFENRIVINNGISALLTMTSDAKYFIFGITDYDGNNTEPQELILNGRDLMKERFDTKQDTLVVGENLDAEPTKNSIYPVTSGGVFKKNQELAALIEEANEMNVKPLADMETYEGFMNTTKISSNENYKYVVLRLSEGTFTITGGSNTLLYYITQSIPVVGSDVEFATDYPSRLSVGAGKTTDAQSISGSSKYLVMQVINNGSDAYPASVVNNNYDVVKGALVEIADLKSDVELKEYRTEWTDENTLNIYFKELYLVNPNNYDIYVRVIKDGQIVLTNAAGDTSTGRYATGTIADDGKVTFAANNSSGVTGYAIIDTSVTMSWNKIGAGKILDASYNKYYSPCIQSMIIEDVVSPMQEDVTDMKPVVDALEEAVGVQVGKTVSVLKNGAFEDSTINVSTDTPFTSLVKSVEDDTLSNYGITKMSGGQSGKVSDASAGSIFTYIIKSTLASSSAYGETIADIVNAAYSGGKIVKVEFYIYSQNSVFPLISYTSGRSSIQVVYTNSSSTSKTYTQKAESFTSISNTLVKATYYIDMSNISDMSSLTSVNVNAYVLAAENTAGITAYTGYGLTGFKVAVFDTLADAQSAVLLGSWENSKDNIEKLDDRVTELEGSEAYWLHDGEKFYSLGDSIAFQQMWQPYVAKLKHLAYQSAATTDATAPLGIGGSTICPKIVLTTDSTKGTVPVMGNGAQMTDEGGNLLWFSTGKAPTQSIYYRSKYFASNYTDAKVVVINAGQNDNIRGRETDSCDSAGSVTDAAYTGLEYVETKYAFIAKYYDNVAIYDDGTLDEEYKDGTYIIITERPTLSACLRAIIKNIIDACPLARIVGNSIMRPNAFLENIDSKVIEKRDAIVNTYKQYCIPVADMWNEMSVNPYNISNYYKYDGDYIHPNDLGGQRMAEIIANKL